MEFSLGGIFAGWNFRWVEFSWVEFSWVEFSDHGFIYIPYFFFNFWELHSLCGTSVNTTGLETSKSMIFIFKLNLMKDDDIYALPRRVMKLLPEISLYHKDLSHFVNKIGHYSNYSSITHSQLLKVNNLKLIT